MIDCLVKLPKLQLKLNPNYKKVQNNIPYYCCEYPFDQVFDKSSADIFSELGIYQHIRGVQMFRSLGIEDRNIHIDGINPELHEGVINWVPEDPLDSDWSTDFFDVSMSKGIKSEPKQNLGSKITFNPLDCKLAESWVGPTQEPVLMRVSVPHRIQNRKNQERWCYSIRFRPSKISYFSLKEILSKFN
jgi:hypothetical protein